MGRTIVAGVAGAGVFGAHHAGKYASLNGVRLGAVHDVDAARAEELAQRFDAVPYTDYEAFLEAVGVVTIATPAVTHFDLASRALARGRHVFVEKPISSRADHARALVDLAAERSLVLQVGHQERIVLEALGVLHAAEPPLRAVCKRTVEPTERGGDVSVILDLMVHDLDLVRAIGFDEPTTAKATGSADTVAAELVFADGRTARFEASRTAERRERRMKVEFATVAVEIDFLHRRLRGLVGTRAADSADPRLHDPLGCSVKRFVDAVDGKCPPAVSGEDGLAAVEWALMIEAALKSEERGRAASQ